MHFHAYELGQNPDQSFGLKLRARLSTDTAGIAACLGLQAEARLELVEIIKALQAKLSPATRFLPFGKNANDLGFPDFREAAEDAAIFNPPQKKQ